MLDFYEAIKYVTSHASDLGVDVSKIAIAGKSLVSISNYFLDDGVFFKLVFLPACLFFCSNR